MGIFVSASVFLVGMLIVFAQINLRQRSVNEVNNQIDFVNNTIQRLVKDSSLIDMSIGSATSTIVLRMASSTMDPTQIYLEDGIIYLEEGSFTPIPLTDSNIVIDNFEAIKYGNNQSYATLQTFLSISYNTSNKKSAFKRSVQTAISRASAAIFDSSIIPNTDSSFDIGNTAKNWNDAYFGGSIGIGVSPVTGAGLITDLDIVISDRNKGYILKSPDGTCYRLTVLNGGNTTTTAVSCP